MKSIEIKNLTKRYNDRIAVNNLSLSIEEGEFFALLGENGAGKTTTIKMLCGLLLPSSGDAFIEGNSIINDVDKVKEIINISPQETAIASNLTVKENLEFVASIYGFDNKKAREKAFELMEQFNLLERCNDRTKTLSGGMQRRLSIAMALISNPKVLFLDEPSLGLDVRARNDLWKQIKLLKGKITIVLTTHYLEEAEALADRLAILSNGNVIIDGSVEELKKITKTSSLEEAYLKVTECE